MRAGGSNGRRAGLIAGVVQACACSEAVRPASLSVVSGEGQAGPVGATGDSLVIVVTGSDGKVFAGATVTWQVTSGDVVVAPLTSMSDAGGRAATAVTLGLNPGSITVTATVAGVAPTMFHLTNVAACDWRAPFAMAATVTAILATTDCTLSDFSFVDYYSLSMARSRPRASG